MTEAEIVPCVNGCLVHGTEEPMEANHGRFCERCFTRVLKNIRLMPQLAEHIISLIVKTGSAPDGAGIRTAKAMPPLPFSEEAFNDANDIARHMARWASIWARVLHESAPWPSRRTWRRDDGSIVGLPADAEPHEVAYEVGIFAKWLEHRLVFIFDQEPDGVQAFDQELRTLAGLRQKWPATSEPYYSDMPHKLRRDGKRCGGQIAVYPPEYAGQDTIVICERCGYQFDTVVIGPQGARDYPNEYEQALAQHIAEKKAMMIRHRRDERRAKAERTSIARKAARVERHLQRKHGRKA